MRSGDAGAERELYQILYRQLYLLARRQMAAQKPDHTLQATALVNEAYLRLVGSHGREWRDSDQFLGLASRAMRTVLMDHARRKGRSKRRPDGERVPLDSLLESFAEEPFELLAIDEALTELEGVDPGLVRLVELRYFMGLAMKETARVLGISVRRAEREWQTARAWLRRELQ